MCMVIGDQKAQALYCISGLAKISNNLFACETKISLNQRRCCSNCCINPRANTEKTTHVLTDKVVRDNIKRYAIRGFQKRNAWPHTFGYPNSNI